MNPGDSRRGRLGGLAILLLHLVPVTLACQSRPTMGGPPDMPAETIVEHPAGVTVQTVATGLDVVWGMVFTPDGRLLITERPGRVRVMDARGALDPLPWKILDDVHSRGEGGLMGIALHPDYPAEPWVYVMYTAQKRGGAVNRVARIQEANERGTTVEVVLDDLPAGTNHNGGRIRFGPDGLLYVGAGEIWERERAQDLDDPGGSLLRIRADGSIPEDNPFPGSPIFSYGHRNVQGITWHPGTGELFTAEHGPSGEWAGVRGRDEINVTRSGANYGWPVVLGAPGLAQFADPILMWPTGAPPGDLLFHPGTAGTAFGGDLFFSTLRSEALLRIRFTDPSDAHRPTEIERWFVAADGRSVYGRLRALAVGPDGALYVGTSNQSRGNPRPGDDRILRIAPVADGRPFRPRYR